MLSLPPFFCVFVFVFFCFELLFLVFLFLTFLPFEIQVSILSDSGEEGIGVDDKSSVHDICNNKIEEECPNGKNIVY